MINFKQIPEWWAFCGNSQCKHAEECLRHRVFKEVPQTVTRWVCVLPTAIKDGECGYFQKTEKVRMARGFRNLFKDIKSRDAQHAIRMELTAYFGSKGTYYRYRDGERWMNPELQQMIADLMLSHGVKEVPVFDEYDEAYDFTKAST